MSNPIAREDIRPGDIVLMLTVNCTEEQAVLTVDDCEWRGKALGIVGWRVNLATDTSAYTNSTALWPSGGNRYHLLRPAFTNPCGECSARAEPGDYLCVACRESSSWT